MARLGNSVAPRGAGDRGRCLRRKPVGLFCSVSRPREGAVRLAAASATGVGRLSGGSGMGPCGLERRPHRLSHAGSPGPWAAGRAIRGPSDRRSRTIISTGDGGKADRRFGGDANGIASRRASLHPVLRELGLCAATRSFAAPVAPAPRHRPPIRHSGRAGAIRLRFPHSCASRSDPGGSANRSRERGCRDDGAGGDRPFRRASEDLFPAAGSPARLASAAGRRSGPGRRGQLLPRFLLPAARRGFTDFARIAHPGANRCGPEWAGRTPPGARPLGVPIRSLRGRSIPRSVLRGARRPAPRAIGPGIYPSQGLRPHFVWMASRNFIAVCCVIIYGVT